jgi:hypothetical protein
MLTVNIRDKMYQILDSWRLINEEATYKKIIAILHILWDNYYKKSKIQTDKFSVQQIEVPKQTTK